MDSSMDDARFLKPGGRYRSVPMLAMDGGMVEENGSISGDPLAHSPGEASVVTVTSVQSVIQPNQQSVIQTPANIQPVQITKGNNVILVGKPNSVIQSGPGSLQTLQVQVVDAGSDDSLSNDDESTKKRRDILTRRPSYRKILNDLGGGEIAVRQLTGPVLNHRLNNSRLVTEESNAISRFSANRGETTSDEEDSELSSHSIPTHYQTVIPAGAIQISSQGGEVQGLHTLTMTNATTAGGTIVQYTQGQDGQFFVPGEYVVTQGGGISGSPIIAEDQQRKREMRLLKNREAARECRRKKKEYIKCLENRVAVLENQNKALIDELKTLKELYCQQKTE